MTQVIHPNQYLIGFAGLARLLEAGTRARRPQALPIQAAANAQSVRGVPRNADFSCLTRRRMWSDWLTGVMKRSGPSQRKRRSPAQRIGPYRGQDVTVDRLYEYARQDVIDSSQMLSNRLWLFIRRNIKLVTELAV
jgi:hypothetical protein